jgi:hypothetical protein
MSTIAQNPTPEQVDVDAALASEPRPLLRHLADGQRGPTINAFLAANIKAYLVHMGLTALRDGDEARVVNITRLLRERRLCDE